MLFNQLIQLPS